MLNITEEQKEMFWSDRHSYNYIFRFPDIVLTFDNEQLHSEEVTVKESICDEEDLRLGGCIASSIEFVVSEITAEQISGLTFTAEIEVRDEDGTVVQILPMGKYIVDNAVRVNDMDYKKVVAYDSMYDVSIDVADWYNALFPITGTQSVPTGEKDEDGNAIMTNKNIYGTTTVKAMRESLLAHMGIPYVPQTLPNDEMTVEKTIEPSAGSLPGTTALKALCTVNGGCGRRSREGKFEVIHIKGLGLFPEDSKGAAVPMEEGGNVYPEETLYPEDRFQHLGMSDEETECPEYRSVTYEEYMTHPITCLKIQSDEEDEGVTIGSDTANPYVLTANFLLYGKDAAQLQSVGENIFRQIRGITYRPASTELDGLPYLEVGDVYALEKRTDMVESYIFSRTLTGIQALIDQYEAKGNKVRANEATPAEEIQILKRKTLKIQKSVDGVSVDLKNLDEQTNGRFEVTDKAISAEVKRASGAEGELSGRIDVTAGQVVLKADADGRIVAVELNADPKEGTEFKVEADNISLTAQEAIQLLSGGTINLSAEQGIEIASPYFSVDKKGDVVARSIEITGGKINFATSLEGDSSILLRNAKYEGAYDGPVRFAGYGPPKSSPIEMGAEVGDVYYDYDSATAYECREPHSASGHTGIYWGYIVLNESDIPPSLLVRFYGDGQPRESPKDIGARPGELYIDLGTGQYYTCAISNGELIWGNTGSGDITKISEWTEISINTESGLSETKYHYEKNLDTGENAKCYSAVSASSEEISFSFSELDGKGKLDEFESTIRLTGNGVSGDGTGYAPRLECDTEMHAKRLSGGNMQSGYVSREMSANVPYYCEVTDLEMPGVPNVVATPVTSNPSAVSVSVADVSESGFKIYMRRTDGNYPLRVNWIAMC